MKSFANSARKRSSASTSGSVPALMPNPGPGMAAAICATPATLITSCQPGHPHGERALLVHARFTAGVAWHWVRSYRGCSLINARGENPVTLNTADLLRKFRFHTRDAGSEHLDGGQAPVDLRQGVLHDNWLDLLGCMSVSLFDHMMTLFAAAAAPGRVSGGWKRDGRKGGAVSRTLPLRHPMHAALHKSLPEWAMLYVTIRHSQEATSGARPVF